MKIQYQWTYLTQVLTALWTRPVRSLRSISVIHYVTKRMPPNSWRQFCQISIYFQNSFGTTHRHIDLGLLISIFLHHLSEKNAQICRKSAQWARGLHDVSNIQHSLSRHRICGWWTASITSTTSTGYGQSTSSARRLFAFVCLSLTKKWRISMCSNLVYGMILEYPRSLMVLGLKGQRSKVKVTVSISAFSH